jgi:hypothetical protein
MLVKREKVSFLDPQPAPINYLKALSKELREELFMKRSILESSNDGFI